MAPATVICDSFVFASSKPTQPTPTPLWTPATPHFSPHYTSVTALIYGREGGSMRSVWEHSRELERENVIPYLFIVNVWVPGVWTGVFNAKYAHLHIFNNPIHQLLLIPPPLFKPNMPSRLYHTK